MKREAPIAVLMEGGRLVPADAIAQEAIERLPRGTRFHAYLEVAKSTVDDEHGRLLSRYMTGIGELYDWLPNTGPGTEFPTAKQLRTHILKEIGFCELHPFRDPALEPRKEALSMQRDKMSFEDLQICFELTRLYVGAWTEALTGERFEPWEKWEQENPK